jgi:YfiH family protein
MITFHQNNQDDTALRWYSSTLITTPHAMLCRQGGVSTKRFASLNLSFATGDSHQAVQENRKKIKQHFAIQHLASCVQVHGKTIRKVLNIHQDKEFPSCDGIVTDQPGVGLLIQQADCQAILFHDPVRRVIAAAHSGWRGSVENIGAATISVMKQEYGCSPADIRVVVSPSLGPCCAEFVNAASELPENFMTHQKTQNHFDFWAISRQQLEEAGIPSKQIDITWECTVCNKNFFSYRRAAKQQATGRNGSIISLPLTDR